MKQLRLKFNELFSLDNNGNIIPLRDIIIDNELYPKGEVMKKTLFGDVNIDIHQDEYDYIIDNLKDGWTLNGIIKIR